MYKIETDGSITRIDGLTVPKDVTNPAYQQYLYWQQHGQYVGPEFNPMVDDNEVVEEVVEEKVPLVTKGK